MNEMTTLEMIGLKALEDKLYEALKHYDHQKENDRVRQCQHVVPFIERDIKEACEILDAIKNNNP